MKPSILATAFLALSVVASALAEAPRGYIARPLEPGISYSQRARDAYAAGTWTLDELAANSTLSPIESTAVYERARAAFEEAVRAEPKMYEAYTYLGYIHRKRGHFDESLKSYAKALEQKPDFVYAIEYQAEAYLGMGDFKRAQFNYLRLYALDTSLAAKLLDAMSEWSRTADIDAAELQRAKTWITAQGSNVR